MSYLLVNSNKSFGLSPPTSLWADCKIYCHDNTMSTPWGKVKPSDIQLVHRYKWSVKERESMYKTLKSKIKRKIFIYLTYKANFWI